MEDVPNRREVLAQLAFAGLIDVQDRMLALKKQTGDAFWTPAPLLDRLADAGKGFLGG